MKKAVLILLAVIVSFVLGMLVESKVHKCDVGDVHTSVEYVSESHHAPVPSDSNVVRYDTIWPDNKEVKNIPKSGNKSAENIPQKAEKIWEDTLKSAENIPQPVVIPITQKVYKDSDYTAYVEAQGDNHHHQAEGAPMERGSECRIWNDPERLSAVCRHWCNV